MEVTLQPVLEAGSNRFDLRTPEGRFAAKAYAYRLINENRDMFLYVLEQVRKAERLWGHK